MRQSLDVWRALKQLLMLKIQPRGLQDYGQDLQKQAVKFEFKTVLDQGAKHKVDQSYLRFKLHFALHVGEEWSEARGVKSKRLTS